ncbi:lysophospholipid acyltransferase family protein [Demequina capsici]|uniref:Lysophospholipid acyltransferase family protein n=1 Tax=Demequina capsici TaxID=3075620 RepID=A0AA96F8W1_9MICO|nr:lysophospholipid acyltransferase family protein [Demequina sp. OYTSA14]WNM25908.1 lysophospholipid acyltransferase family protein [Demequina sp. OYTSA14]
MAKVLWRTEVRHLDRLPRSGPVIVVANHVGIADGPLLHGVIPRGSHFLIGGHMMEGLLGRILRVAQQIKVEGGGRQALAQAYEVLKRGDVVGVFPEGTRGGGTAESVHGGAAWLALRTRAPVVPVAILGTRLPGESVSAWPELRRRMLMDFGEATSLDTPQELKGRARQDWADQRVGEILRDHLAAVLPTTDLELPRDDPRAERAANEAQEAE